MTERSRRSLLTPTPDVCLRPRAIAADPRVFHWSESGGPPQSCSSIPQQPLRRLRLWLDVNKAFLVCQHQGHDAAKTRLGEAGNRAWIDPMFVERIWTDLQLDTSSGELGQFRRQIV